MHHPGPASNPAYISWATTTTVSLLDSLARWGRDLRHKGITARASTCEEHQQAKGPGLGHLHEAGAVGQAPKLAPLLQQGIAHSAAPFLQSRGDTSFCRDAGGDADSMEQTDTHWTVTKSVQPSCACNEPRCPSSNPYQGLHGASTFPEKPLEKAEVHVRMHTLKASQVGRPHTRACMPDAATHAAVSRKLFREAMPMAYAAPMNPSLRTAAARAPA